MYLNPNNGPRIEVAWCSRAVIGFVAGSVRFERSNVGSKIVDDSNMESWNPLSLLCRLSVVKRCPDWCVFVQTNW